MGIRTINLTNDLMQTTPPFVRLFIAMVLVGFFTWLAARIMRPRRAAFLAVPEGQPPAQDMLNVALGVLLTAYVFIAAFLLASFWSSQGEAIAASNAEQSQISEAVAALRAGGELPDDVRQAIDAYVQSAIDVQGPALRDGDGEAAARVHTESSAALVEVVGAWAAETKTPAAAVVMSAIRDAITSGNDRINALPSDATYRVVQLLGFVGIACLALAVILAPAARGPSIIVLGTFVFGITLLYVLLIEYVNPFLTGGAAPFPRM